MNTDHFRGLHVHLLGIGGTGVSALVPLLRAAGADVSGCDAEESPAVHRLRRDGVHVAHGHAAAHAAAADLLVHSSAIPADHPELIAGRARGIPVLSRGACLIQLMEGCRTIAIAGSHGKTSTTWMTGHLLTAAGADPVVMVGGAVAALRGGGARAGGSRLFVAETDESDGSFAGVLPEIAVVTNLDHEHLRFYGGSFARLVETFRRWLAAVPAHGAVIVPHDGLPAGLLDGVQARIVRCGLSGGDVRALGLELGPEGSRCRVVADGCDLGELHVPLPGAHMAGNALMALAAARLAGPGVQPSHLIGCERVQRRFTVHGTPRGIRVVEDYGHHPTEVRATIAAARLSGGRVHVLFQPHRPSRTADCFADFVAAFDQAHSVAVLPIYAAGEAAIPGVDSERLARSIIVRRGGHDAAGLGANPVRFVRTPDEGLAFLAQLARPGDTCLVLGAGDVGAAAPQLVETLRNTRNVDSTSTLLAVVG